MRRWRILTIGHTDVFLHPAVFLCAVYAFATGYGMLWLIASLSIIVHEFAHACTAALFRCPPAALELTPIGAVMRIDDETKLPLLKRAIMLSAGPLSSIAMCMLAICSFHNEWLDTMHAYQLFVSNLSIAIINLLPVLPLDGGRLLRLILARFISERIAAIVMRTLGTIAGVGLILLNLYVSVRYGGWNLSLAFAGCSILYSTSAAMTSNALEELRMLMERKITLERREIVRCTAFCVMGNTTLDRLLRICPSRTQAYFGVINHGSMDLLGWLSEHQVIQHYMTSPRMTAKEALFLCQNHSESAKYDTI